MIDIEHQANWFLFEVDRSKVMIIIINQEILYINLPKSNLCLKGKSTEEIL